MKFLYILLFLPFSMFAQVGIGTTNPLGVLHIDGKKNNGSTNSPTNIKDDVIIATTSGNLGIGTLTPAAKVTVINNDNVKPTIRIDDGTQGLNKILTSDANGVASWNYGNNSNPIVGKFDAQVGMTYSYNSHATTDQIYTSAYIDLPPGTWQINYVFLLQCVTTGKKTSNWLELKTGLVEVISGTPSTSFTSDIYNGNQVNTHIYGYSCYYSLGKGTYIIRNQSAATKRYGIVMVKPTKYSSDLAKNLNFTGVMANNRGENSLTAFRVNLD